MWRLVRFALTWLLAFAVPAQGFAAASLLHCGPGHHGETAQVVSQSGHAHAWGEAATPHGHADVVAPDTPSVADTSLAVRTKAFHKGSCSACASCCTAAAMPAAVATFDATAVRDRVAPLAPPSVAAFLTDGPERPPRALFA